MIYLDNASTTKPDSQVLQVMNECAEECYFNPGGIHAGSLAAKKLVDEAREKVADFIGAEPNEIIFTSGATEGNNMALSAKGVFDGYKTNLLTSETEHDSVLTTLEAKGRSNWDTVFPNLDGVITFDGFYQMCRKLVPGFVSIMYMNNETGAVNDVYNIGDFCKRNKVIFHCDATQAVACMPVSVDVLKCDYLTFSAHKFHGPKGIGALYCRNKNKKVKYSRDSDPWSYSTFRPLIYGGRDQEFGLRGGTENVPAIVGFAKACELQMFADHSIPESYKVELYKTIYHTLLNKGLSQYMHVNGQDPYKFNGSHILNVRFDGVDAETLILSLSSKGVYASAGSACRSHEQTPSRTLMAMGLSEEEARNSVRFSTSRMNTMNEMYEAGKIIGECVSELINIESIPTEDGGDEVEYYFDSGITGKED